MTDMVYNHTADDSEWLPDHPDSAYNLQNSPHLKPAYLVDRLLYYVSRDISHSKLESHGIPADINNEDHLNVS